MIDPAPQNSDCASAQTCCVRFSIYAARQSGDDREALAGKRRCDIPSEFATRSRGLTRANYGDAPLLEQRYISEHRENRGRRFMLFEEGRKIPLRGAENLSAIL